MHGGARGKVYEVTIREVFSAAHSLRNYGGKCEELHGHNFKVDVTVEARQLDQTGLALDFRILKEETRKVLSLLDHAFLNDLEPFRDRNPSSENIAKFVYEGLCQRIQVPGIKVKRVRVWESENACASYLGEGK